MTDAATIEPANLSNGFVLTDAEKGALLLDGLRKLEEFAEEKSEIDKDIKELKTTLVGYGFTKKAIAFAVKLKSADESDAIEQRRAEMEVARFLNHPIGTQPELPLSMVDRTPGEDSAFADGELAGAAGRTCSAPHPLGSPFEQSWVRGWHQGQATITSAFKKLEAKAAAASEAPAEDSHEV